jgi:ParB family chromosome partitioning protein
MASELGISKNQIFRFIRLTELLPELLDMVDSKQIAFNPAVEISYLKPDEQKDFLEAMDAAQSTPSLSQAQRIKKLSQAKMCTLEAMCEIMNEEKKDDLSKVTISHEVLRKYFPRSYTPKQMEAQIIKLLEQWQKKKTRGNEL